jgi:hypothetical protein
MDNKSHVVTVPSIILFYSFSFSSEEKAKLLRHMSAKIENLDAELTNFMSSLQLDIIGACQNPERLPQVIISEEDLFYSFSFYSEEKAKLLRHMSAKIENLDAELTNFMSSLQLDIIGACQNPERLPQVIEQLCLLW